MNISIESIRDFFEYYYYRSYCYWIKKKTVGPESVAIATIAIPIGFYGIGIALLWGLPLPSNETGGIIVVVLMLIFNYIFNEKRRELIFRKYSSRTEIDEKKEIVRGRINWIFFYFSHVFVGFSVWFRH